MKAEMDVSMGGRVAEELIFGKEKSTSGASSDLQGATRTAENLVGRHQAQLINLTTTQTAVGGTQFSAIEIGRHICQIILRQANCSCRRRLMSRGVVCSE
jgi:ATP-dependent Zn protease